jgi:hypothetical protein
VKRFLEIVAAVLGTVAVIFTAAWYVFDLDSRVRQLEKQVHTLTVAPVIAKSGENSVNPVAQACADLARQKAVTSDADPFSPSSEQIRSAMADLGCSAPH